MRSSGRSRIAIRVLSAHDQTATVRAQRDRITPSIGIVSDMDQIAPVAVFQILTPSNEDTATVRPSGVTTTWHCLEARSARSSDSALFESCRAALGRRDRRETRRAPWSERLSHGTRGQPRWLAHRHGVRQNRQALGHHRPGDPLVTVRWQNHSRSCVAMRSRARSIARRSFGRFDSHWEAPGSQ